MESKFFSLEIRENNRITKVVQILFGIVCVAIAVFWIIFNIRSLKSYGTPWATIIFLMGFGVFQVLSGTGYTAKFIELKENKIILKKNSLLPPVDIFADQIEKVELFPLCLIFIIKPAKRILLRFGVTHPDRIELIKNEIVNFVESNKIQFEIKDEQI